MCVFCIFLYAGFKVMWVFIFCVFLSVWVFMCVGFKKIYMCSVYFNFSKFLLYVRFNVLKPSLCSSGEPKLGFIMPFVGFLVFLRCGFVLWYTLL